MRKRSKNSLEAALSILIGATRDLLDRAGFRMVDRHEFVKEKLVEQLNALLVCL